MSRFRSMTAIAGALAVMGCASVAPERPAAPLVVPSQTVRHGMDADAHYRTGRYFQGQVRFEQAIDAYRRVLAAQPGHVDALNGLGVIYSLQRRPELAEQAFRLALEADPQAARVHNNLGYHLLHNGRAAEAITAFERARELEPGNVDTQANLAMAREKMGLRGEAAVAGVATPVPMRSAVPAQLPPAASAAAPATTPAQVAVIAPGAAPAADASTAQANTVPVALARVSEGIWVLGSVKAAPVADETIGAAPAEATGKVEIANGNGTAGLARRVSGMVAPPAAPRPRLTNHKPYGVQASRIQYVAGSERQAQEINARLPSPLPLARTDALERDVRVRVLLGKDFPQRSFASEFSTWRNS